MFGHLEEVFEPERHAGCDDCHAHHIDDRFVLMSPQELKINFSLPACASHAKLGMTGFSKKPTFYVQL